MALWKLEDDAIFFVRYIREELLKVGWAVALGGSVLYAGESNKDIDLVLFPLGTEDGMHASKPIADVRACLEAWGLTMRASEETVKRQWLEEFGSRDTKHVEIWEFGGRRVDLFFLS